jgi:hypothetical protein
MKRGKYLRFTCYMVPFSFPFTTSLDTTAMLSIELWTMEGWLLHTLFVGERIEVTVRIKEHEPVLGIFRSGPILNIQGQYALTRQSLYQFVKVPPSRNETFGQFA